MADKLKVDPVALHHGSNQMFDAVGEAALDFISHEDGLAEPRRVGSARRSWRWASWRHGGRPGTANTSCRWAGWDPMWPTRWSATSRPRASRPGRSGP
jgi:hypothetical protein